MCEKRSDQEISLRATKKIVRDNSKHKRSSRSSASYSLLIVKDGAQSGILMIRKVFLSKRCGVKKGGNGRNGFVIAHAIELADDRARLTLVMERPSDKFG